MCATWCQKVVEFVVRCFHHSDASSKLLQRHRDAVCNLKGLTKEHFAMYKSVQVCRKYKGERPRAGVSNPRQHIIVTWRIRPMERKFDTLGLEPVPNGFYGPQIAALSGGITISMMVDGSWYCKLPPLLYMHRCVIPMSINNTACNAVFSLSFYQRWLCSTSSDAAGWKQLFSSHPQTVMQDSPFAVAQSKESSVRDFQKDLWHFQIMLKYCTQSLGGKYISGPNVP